MQLLCAGISYRTAPIALRERLAFDEESALAAFTRLREDAGFHESLSELVILSTCNRVELYAAGQNATFDALVAFLEAAKDLPGQEIHPHLYRYSGQEAAEHLLSVAAGLDSLVLGEPQILGQVGRAFEQAQRQGGTGPVLSRLFQVAVHAGKRVRTETAIAQNPASIPSVAVRLAGESFPHLESARVVILGAGEMASLVVETLRKRGTSSFTVINRTLQRAQELANRWQIEAGTFDGLADTLQDADILITSVSSPQAVITPSLVAQAMQKRPDRLLLIIDIAVPRNVQPQVGEIPSICLLDMDTLQASLSRSLVARSMEVPEAQAILAEETGGFMDILAELELLPVIKAMRQQAESIRQVELEKTLRRLPGITEEERRRIETLTVSLVSKLLHAPITRLRSEARYPHASDFTYVASSLFGLPPETHQPPQWQFPAQPAACESPEDPPPQQS